MADASPLVSSAREAATYSRSVGAACDVLMAIVKRPKYAKEKSLGASAQSLKTLTDRLGVLRKKSDATPGDNYSTFNEAAGRVLPSVSRMALIIRRKNHTDDFLFCASAAARFNGAGAKSMSDLCSSMASLVTCVARLSMAEHEAACEKATAAIAALSTTASTAFTTAVMGSDASAAKAATLNGVISATAAQLVATSRSIIGAASFDPLSKDNMDFDTQSAVFLGTLRAWLNLLGGTEFRAEPTEGERAIKQHEEALRLASAATKGLSVAREAWRRDFIALSKAAEARQAPLFDSLAGTARQLIAAIERCTIRGISGAQYSAQLAAENIPSQGRTIAHYAKFDAVLKRVTVELEVAMIDATNQLLAEHPRLAIVINPSAEEAIDQLEAARGERSAGSEPATSDLMKWCKAKLDGTPHAGINDFTPNTWGDGVVLHTLLTKCGATEASSDTSYALANRRATSLKLPLTGILTLVEQAEDRRSERVEARGSDAFVPLQIFLAALRGLTETDVVTASTADTPALAAGSPAVKAKASPAVKEAPAAPVVTPTRPADVPESDQPVTGWLEKKAQTGRRNWKGRFFILRNAHLQYFDNEKMEDVRGEMNLSECLVAKSDDYAHEYRFILMSTTSDRTLLLRAETAEKRDIWLHSITRAVGKKKKGGDKSTDSAPANSTSASTNANAAAGPSSGGGDMQDGNGSDKDKDEDEAEMAEMAEPAQVGDPGEGTAGAEAEDENMVTDDKIRETAIQALQWAKRIVRAPNTANATRESLFAAGKSLRGVLVELKELLAVQREQRASPSCEESNERLAGLCESLFTCTLKLIQTCRDIMEESSKGGKNAATTAEKTKAISMFADAIAAIVYEQATIKNIRTAAVGAAKAAKNVRDATEKVDLVRAAETFVPASKRLVHLVKRRCDALGNPQMTELLNRHCTAVMEETHKLISATMEAVKKGGDADTTAAQQTAVEQFTTGVASIVTLMEG